MRNKKNSIAIEDAGTAADYKVRDLHVGGISFIIANRDEFDAVLTNKTFAELLGALNKKSNL